jgi:hypothetical protein
VYNRGHSGARSSSGARVRPIITSGSGYRQQESGEAYPNHMNYQFRDIPNDYGDMPEGHELVQEHMRAEYSANEINIEDDNIVNNGDLRKVRRVQQRVATSTVTRTTSVKTTFTVNMGLSFEDMNRHVWEYNRDFKENIIKQV